MLCTTPTLSALSSCLSRLLPKRRSGGLRLSWLQCREADTDRNATINDVVVDPSISVKLRDHQRDGVLVSYGQVAVTHSSSCTAA